MDQRDVGPQRRLQKKIFAVDADDLLALRRQGADAGFGQDASQTVSAGADAFGERALRRQIDLDRAVDHLRLRLGIGADMADDRAADAARRDQLADAMARPRRIIADHGQIPASGGDDGAEKPLRRTDRHEAAEHHTGSVGDEGDRFFDRRRAFHIDRLLARASAARGCGGGSCFASRSASIAVSAGN